MKIIAAIIMSLLAFAAQARESAPHAAEVASMFAHCNCVMSAGQCAGFAEAKASLPPADLARPRLLGMLGTVPAGIWYDFNADIAMCDSIPRECALDWTGNVCRIARSQFRQDSNFECGPKQSNQADAEAASKVAGVMTLALAAIVLVGRLRGFTHARQ